MLNFYNWRIKRSGAGLRIIGDIGMGNDHAILQCGQKISNIGLISVAADNSINAYDRAGIHVAILALSPRRVTFDEAAALQHNLKGK